jgi:hypothetical protein
LGFDVDHTLGLYNITALSELLYTSFTKYLIEKKNYPKNLNVFDPNIEQENLKSKNFNFLTVENFFEFSGIELFADINTGVISRIDENNKILKALYGIKELNNEEISEIYGKDKKIPDKYNFHFEDYRTDNYIYLQGYFENHMTSLLTFCIELYKNGLLENIINNNNENSPYKKIIEDIYESLNFNYVSNEGQMKDYGYFYPEIFNNPKKYLAENSAKETLIQLRKFGVKIFYATNSPKEFGDLIMRNTFGEDFLDYFDLAVSFARKPKFFKNNNSTENDLKFFFPSCKLEKYYDNNKEISLKDYLFDEELHQEIKSKKAIICNSFEFVKNFFEKILGKKKINYLYVGDSLVNDGLAPVLHAKIKSICVIDCIDSNYHGIKPDNIGIKWDLEKHLDKEQYHVKHAREHCEFSISNVQSLRLFL